MLLDVGGGRREVGGEEGEGEEGKGGRTRSLSSQGISEEFLETFLLRQSAPSLLQLLPFGPKSLPLLL